MKEVGKFASYSIGPDPKAPGDHVCRVTLIIKAAPGSITDLAQACGDLIGLDVFIDLTAIQGHLNLVTGEVA